MRIKSTSTILTRATGHLLILVSILILSTNPVQAQFSSESSSVISSSPSSITSSPPSSSSSTSPSPPTSPTTLSTDQRKPCNSQEFETCFNPVVKFVQDCNKANGCACSKISVLRSCLNFCPDRTAEVWTLIYSLPGCASSVSKNSVSIGCAVGLPLAAMMAMQL
ncbi:hypothetical protein BC829DRAFT_390604 [Chytridium lagenaria]|nr:hypothetical protein BC829DRAFT_390604 [Chytridium lagenaria]